MDPGTITNGWIAFITGLITSPHCVIMCGPLVFVMLSKNPSSSPSPLWIPQFSYHLARIFSFTLIGTIAGAIGLNALKLFQARPTTLFPYALIIFLLLFAFGFDRLIPKIPFAKRIFARASERLNTLPKLYTGISLGLLTPFLPCGPLYLIFWVCILSGSPLLAAQISSGFALGTIPLMLPTGSAYFKFKHKFNPKKIHNIQRFLAVIAALFILWRTLNADGPLSAEFCCPWN